MPLSKVKQAANMREHRKQLKSVIPKSPTVIPNKFLLAHLKVCPDAEFAIVGQAKILTQEAYNQFLGLVKSLDIPDSALPELTLPYDPVKPKNHYDHCPCVNPSIHNHHTATLHTPLASRDITHGTYKDTPPNPIKIEKGEKGVRR